MPLPNARIIPAGWQAHHRPVVVTSMTATGQLRRPDLTGTRSTATGRTTFATPELIYTGPCRVQLRSTSGGSGTVVTVADHTTTRGDYLIVIPSTAPVALVGDRWTVTADPHNPALVGLSFQVVFVAKGSLTWEQDLDCNLETPTARG